MTTKTRVAFENISVYVDEYEMDKLNIVNESVLSPNAKNIGIWHTIVIHHAANNDKSLVGGLYLIFKNENADSKMALSLHLSGSAKGNFETDAEFMTVYVKYAFEFINECIKEDELKDENDNIFTIPEYYLSADYFRFGFPD